MNISGLAGRDIDEYKLVQVIGEGGMSAVYRGYQEELDRYVAVKILSGDLANNPDYLQRFTVEAKMAASLEHPHIVPVYDFGVQTDLTYVVMRLLQTTLGQKISSDDDRLTLSEFVQMAESIAKALDYAHSRGIIHRDVKPNNIMFDAQGTAYLVDFGIAKAVQSDLNLTAENIVLGTPQYMPPEQWRDENISPQSDQYSLAIVLFKTLTGELPFAANTSSQIMYKHLHEAPPNASEFNPQLPQTVNAVLQRAMSKDPNHRYPKVSNFVNALKDALNNKASVAQTVINQPAIEAQPNMEATLEHPALIFDESMDVTYQQPAISSDVIQQKPSTSKAPETYKRMPAAVPQQQPTATPAPRVLPKSASKQRKKPKQKTMMMKVAQGGMLGIAALLIIAIVVVVALLFFFAPSA